MKDKKSFFMVLVALFMGSQMAIFAQGKKEGKMDRKQFGQEQMQKMQCNQLINALALDDAETAKFKPVYTKYMEEMRAVRDMNPLCSSFYAYGCRSRTSNKGSFCSEPQDAGYS